MVDSNHEAGPRCLLMAHQKTMGPRHGSQPLTIQRWPLTRHKLTLSVHHEALLVAAVPWRFRCRRSMRVSPPSLRPSSRSMHKNRKLPGVSDTSRQHVHELELQFSRAGGSEDALCSIMCQPLLSMTILCFQVPLQ